MTILSLFKNSLRDRKWMTRDIVVMHGFLLWLLCNVFFSTGSTSELNKMGKGSIGFRGEHLSVSVGSCLNITILCFFIALNCLFTEVNKCLVEIGSLLLVDISVILHDLALQVSSQGRLWNDEDISRKVKDRHQLPIIWGAQSCV